MREMLENRFALIPIAASKATLILDCRIEEGKNSEGRDVKNNRKS